MTSSTSSMTPSELDRIQAEIVVPVHRLHNLAENSRPRDAIQSQVGSSPAKNMTINEDGLVENSVAKRDVNGHLTRIFPKELGYCLDEIGLVRLG